ncbi:MAG TPA: DnaJ domain-containing protein [Myxococcaceae bacterium]|nr:DnaJ domain-containing protein [Myxococcaceae bacterium]
MAGPARPPPPPIAPSIAPLVPSVAPVVPPIAPAVAPVVPPVAPARAPRVPGVAPALPSAAPATPPPPPPAATGRSASLDEQQLAELQSRCARLDQLDYFEVLKLEKTATPADIKRAFYRESRTYHPDRFFHLEEKELKDRVHELYKRVTEAYYVLRDDTKRRLYLADVTGPERAHKLRFTEASEAETRAAAKRQHEEQIGLHPKGRQFYQTGVADADAGRWAAAERNLKMALTYEPSNARYKEKLAEVQKVINDESRNKGDAFKIR